MLFVSIFCCNIISTHTLRVEGDAGAADRDDFEIQISTHTLRVEGDRYVRIPYSGFAISTHTLRVEGDSLCPAKTAVPTNFNPHPPRGG